MHKRDVNGTRCGKGKTCDRVAFEIMKSLLLKILKNYLNYPKFDFDKLISIKQQNGSSLGKLGNNL